MIKRSQYYELLTSEMRPQDEHMDGSTLTFETVEHGGEEPDCMPCSVKVTDPEGRWCLYRPVTIHGKPVRFHSGSYYDGVDHKESMKRDWDDYHTYLQQKKNAAN